MRQWSLWALIFCLGLFACLGCGQGLIGPPILSVAAQDKGDEKKDSKAPADLKLPVPKPVAAPVLPEIPKPEELKNETVTDGLPPTAQKIIAAHRAALDELQKKYEEAGNKDAAAAVKNHLKSTADRIADLEKAVQEYLKK
jgi:hypothetical protein